MSASGPAGVPACIRGVISPLFTPFRADRSIDYSAVPSLVQYLVDTRAVSSIFARSGVGQIFTFTVGETREFGRRVRDAAGDRAAVVLGCPGEWLDRSPGARPDPERYLAQGIELTQDAATYGIDAAVHPLPVALLPEPGEPVADLVFRYYRTINDAASLPVVIYQQPGTPLEYCLTPDLIARLAALDRVIGAKVSSEDPAVMDPLLAASQGTTFRMICGHERYYLRGLEQGAVGVIGQGGMGAPEVQYAVQERYRAGDLAGAREASDDVAATMRITEGLSRSVAYKQYVRRKGVLIEPYERGACEPYDQGTSEPYPDDVIDRVEQAMDAMRTKYRVG